MQLIDFHQFAGVKISRELNKKNGISLASPFFMDVKNFSLYMPRNPMALAGILFK